MKYEGDGDTNCIWHVWNDPQRLDKRAGGIVNRGTNRDHPNCSIVEIDQNSEKNIGNFKRLAVTQTPVKDYQLTLVRKSLIRNRITRNKNHLTLQDEM